MFRNAQSTEFTLQSVDSANRVKNECVLPRKLYENKRQVYEEAYVQGKKTGNLYTAIDLIAENIAWEVVLKGLPNPLIDQ